MKKKEEKANEEIEKIIREGQKDYKRKEDEAEKTEERMKEQREEMIRENQDEDHNNREMNTKKRS